MDQKSFLASPSYHDESRSGVEEDPSGSRWRRFPCSSPRSGRSRIEVDVLRMWSPAESFTVPSAIGKMNCSPLMGVNTSFALSLSALISDASICSNSAMSATNKSPFQILTRAKRIQRRIQVRLLDRKMQWRQVFGRKRVIFYHRSKRNNRAIKWFPKTSLIWASSHQTWDLERFADRCNIP